MQPFETYRGRVAVLNRANVDTDQIIPKQFLKSIQRTGFGKSLFFDWRYTETGEVNPDFELNQPEVEGAGILVTGNNFGCGSSREHAVWAVMQDGFKVVIAPAVQRDGVVVPGFADIFRNNAVKNGLLTIQLPEGDVQAILERFEAEPGLEATVDLEQQTIALHAAEAKTIPFEVDPATKDHLLRGLDEVALTLEHDGAIADFEAGHDNQLARA